ncbi:uncharacterized protein LOC117818719 isoform X3 [Notolabrus celidotus]|uniref:uncharacterized protein LOC117818719 isoform X3 n=1 Tax=Notolabrus celidotus TaxID=1203425 RepID=UPI00148F6DB2|nr:uncharacterized protein LOC117818719 isoform X3 [Notolabrus celidotus]XP_034547622.1 uncharacterized protein LOC117818719 isoform X3 [Notolabrus celidotus]
MMDDLTAKEGHLPWVGQNGWSTTSAQGPLLNPMSSSQHLSLGSSSIQRSSYNHLQVPNQSCMRDLSSLLSSNSPHQSALYKASQAGSSPSPGMLFADTVMPNVPQVIPFAQEIPHTSSMLLSANQGKSIPSLSLIQRNQAQQHLSLPPPQDPYKVSFQPQITSHGLPNGLQTLPISLPSCGLSEQCQWIPSSLCRGAVNESLPGAAAHPNKEQSQEGNINPLASNERQRLVLLNQRAQLLQQLAELDKALESMPPEDSSDGQPPHTANQPTPSMEDSQCEEMKTSDAQQDQVPTAKSENKEPDSAESGDDGNLDDPVSDDDFSEFIPDPAGFSSDDSYHSRPSTPVDEKPVLSGQESNESGSPPKRLPQAASWDQNECSSAPNGPSTFNHPPAHEEMRGDNMTTPQPSVNPDKKGSKSKSIHRTWEEAEVQAVERHMMRFIQRQKVPQKDDCVECLEAEPEALSTRSWKGVKDYVRNRITALKRISGTSKAS